MAGMTREDIDLAQLQDTESGAEIMHMAENGFCKDGEQEKLLQDGDTKLNGSGVFSTTLAGLDDYRAQEFPNGSPATVTTYTLRVTKA